MSLGKVVSRALASAREATGSPRVEGTVAKPGGGSFAFDDAVFGEITEEDRANTIVEETSEVLLIPAENISTEPLVRDRITLKTGEVYAVNVAKHIRPFGTSLLHRLVVTKQSIEKAE